MNNNILKTESTAEQSESGADQCYCIFIDTLCGGMTPVLRDEVGKWVVYKTREAAKMEIEDDEREMLRQYLAGERDLDHGIESEDIICKVTRLPDGSVVDEWGRVFGV